MKAPRKANRSGAIQEWVKSPRESDPALRRVTASGVWVSTTSPARTWIRSANSESAPLRTGMKPPHRSKTSRRTRSEEALGLVGR
ncbi:hypothetical protein [Ornithinimicrobium sp. CNJ-824]|uniref:hypothetical protein n=1 Tax=Ornithinimicrobium sp. CNJ-824 TaxID=1904966 RepID=UPI001ED9DDCF|nr:hypothetical protein [Ornithinimicrobium sp. CNJ-824]